jgi:hypothetical protein
VSVCEILIFPKPLRISQKTSSLFSLACQPRDPVYNIFFSYYITFLIFSTARGLRRPQYFRAIINAAMAKRVRIDVEAICSRIFPGDISPLLPAIIRTAQAAGVDVKPYDTLRTALRTVLSTVIAPKPLIENLFSEDGPFEGDPIVGIKCHGVEVELFAEDDASLLQQIAIGLIARTQHAEGLPLYQALAILARLLWCDPVLDGIFESATTADFPGDIDDILGRAGTYRDVVRLEVLKVVQALSFIRDMQDPVRHIPNLFPLLATVTCDLYASTPHGAVAACALRIMANLTEAGLLVGGAYQADEERVIAAIMEEIISGGRASTPPVLAVVVLAQYFMH